MAQGNPKPVSFLNKRSGDVSVAFGSVLATPGGHRRARLVKAHHVSPVRRLLRQRPVSFRWPPVDIKLAHRCPYGNILLPYLLAW
jgi:hypothetical protein